MTKDLLHINGNKGEHAPSWYQATAGQIPAHPEMAGALRCDVCIVGAGFTGASAALHLAEKGYDVILLDAHKVGWGASGRNGGQLCSGQRKEQDELEKTCGPELARKAWDIAEEAKKLVRTLIKKHDIQAHYRKGIIHAAHKKSLVDSYRHYADFLQTRYQYNQIKFMPREEINETVASPSYHGGTMDEGAGHLHPLNLVLGIAEAARKKGVRIFEQTEVLDIEMKDPVRLKTAKGSVEARFAIIAGNGYVGGLAPRLNRYIVPLNNFVVTTSPLGEKAAEALIKNDAAVADSLYVINYFRRTHDHRLLFGGGETYRYRFPADIKSVVGRCVTAVFPQLKGVTFDYSWGGTLAITMARLPIFQRAKPNVYTVAGYSGQGVALGVMAGKILAEAIDGTATRFDVMAGLPQKILPGGALLRHPLMVLGMLWHAMLDRI